MLPDIILSAASFHNSSVEWGEGQRSLCIVKSSLTYVEARRYRRKHRLFQVVNLGNVPGTLFKITFLLDMSLQNIWYVFSALIIQTLATNWSLTKLVAEQCVLYLLT